MRTAIAVLILAILATASANAGTIGDWSDDTYTEGLYAATVNDSGNLLGQYCNTANSTCFWMIALKTGCKAESKYPILVNSDIGAHSLEVYCGGEIKNGYHRYFFTNFDAIDNLVKNSTRIGFAAPLQGDQFQVVRFSLSGARATIDRMRAAAAEGSNKPVRSDTRDQRL
jgi:hypothetical protein